MESSKINPLQVAIVGLGTVGSGVARLLGDFGERTARHAGRPLLLKHVVVRDLKKPRQVKLPAGIVSTDIGRITADPDVSIVALLVGGMEPARTYMLKLLESGKDVVTANKALLAEHGPELFDRARGLGRSIAFEASVAGGIPIIANISTCLSANQIESMHAILNGTSNYILTQMEALGATYAEAVAEAQRLGFAEADPSMDVDGSDAAQKLAILAHLAFARGSHGTKSPAAASTRSTRKICGWPGSWAIASSCWPWPGPSPAGWKRTFRPPWSSSARRWPKSAERITPSAWWGTRSAGFFIRAWEPARCRPLRPWWPT